MPKRSAATIQNRMVESALNDKEVPGAVCAVCGHLKSEHRRMRSASFCTGCHKMCTATSTRTY